MKPKFLLATVLSLIAVAAAAQNLIPSAPPPQLTTDQRIAQLERQVTDLQNRVLQLEDTTKLKIRPLTENR
jgi:peptidoglycan hydrolase CwlO-like protein